MNAKIERTMIDVEKARSVTEAVDLIVDSLCVESGELERLARLQNLILVLYDELKIIMEDVAELAENSRVVDAYLVAEEKKKEREEEKKNGCFASKNQGV